MVSHFTNLLDEITQDTVETSYPEVQNPQVAGHWIRMRAMYIVLVQYAL